jgi:DNA polymerase-3 subunit delta'
MSYRAISGHGELIRLLSRAVARRSLPPSLLFTGPDGVGKRRVALATAQAMNCAEPRSADATAEPPADLEQDSCDACAACQRIIRGTYSDVLVVEPGESGSITVDQVRQLIDHTSYRPFEGRRRVVIIDNADTMVPAAQNALLKTLEEPPDSSQFILVSARPDVLLDTVRSRCPRLRFGQLGVEEIAGVLAAAHGYDDHDARAAAVSAGGSLARALQVASGDLTTSRESALSLLRAISAGSDPRGRLEGAKTLLPDKRGSKRGPASAEREALTSRLRALASLLRDIELLAADGDGPALANTDLRDQLAALVPLYGGGRGQRGFQSIARAIGAVRANVGPKVVADWIACQL